ALLSLSLGRRLGLSRGELAELGVSAFLHDLGKLDIPRDILDKPGPLDGNEWSVMESHAQLGAERVIEFTVQRGFPNRAVQVALEHHLKPDLAGYPRYERKKRIGLYSKIVKITDYFDALTTKRSYRPKAFTPEEALALMLSKGEREFDPLLLKTFASMVGIHPVGSLVALDTGEVGVVFGLSVLPGSADRPKVKVIADAGGQKIDGPEVDLTDVDPTTRTYKRTIVKVLDPEKYGVTVSEYFLARTSPL
ncbi:MAG: HD domain-containing protein, partial [Candidatus Aminicenantes bacterium]|nr:HD domain-containing protein [Candidatus Aminicenantes bacterium]